MTATTLSSALPADDSILQSLRAEYDRYSRAICEMDLTAIQSMLSEDFVWTLTDGSSMDKGETMRALRQHFSTVLAFDPMRITIMECETREDTATVLVCESTTGVISEGEPMRFKTVETVRELWQIQSDAWQIKAAEVLQSQTLTMPIG